MSGSPARNCGGSQRPAWLMVKEALGSVRVVIFNNVSDPTEKEGEREKGNTGSRELEHGMSKTICFY